MWILIRTSDNVLLEGPLEMEPTPDVGEAALPMPLGTVWSESRGVFEAEESLEGEGVTTGNQALAWVI